MVEEVIYQEEVKMKVVKRFPKLFQPGHIGKLEIKNRIVLAPMGTMYVNLDGSYSQREIDYLVARAKGGAGLILTGATAVEKQVNPPDYPLAAYMDSNWQIPRASDLVDAVHDYGAKIGIQLSPGSGRNMPEASSERTPVSASAVPIIGDPDVLCHELKVEEIKKIILACGDAAQRAVRAGFDMIEIHAHAGYLVDQFMTPLWNKRNDEYGGDIERRMRFAIDIINAIRAKVGADFPLCFRYSAEHGIDGGRTLPESQEVAQRLEAGGVDILHMDAGCFEVPPWIVPPTYMPLGCFADFAMAIKQVVNIPVITVGSIMSPELAEQILDEGKADFICLGRALIADPDWPNKAKEGQTEDIRPCIRCNEGCIGRAYFLKSMSCSVNPTVGKERYYAITQAEKPKKVMIIGGGPAGMEAARVAALRGHEVILYEKENELGGQLRAASKPSFKSSVGNLVNYLCIQLSKLGVKVETGKEVTSHLVDRARPEAVVVATGAIPLMSSIPGVENEKIITAVDLLLGKKRVGNEVIVLGAALVGCDTALYLAQEGKSVNIIKMRPGTEIAQDLNPFSRLSLLEELAKNGVTILTNLTIREFTDEGVAVTDKEEKQQTLKADTIVLALGAESENKLVENLKGKVSELYVVGDCVSPRKIGEAMHEGFVAGWRI
jgi:2-enoate reductase